MHYWLMKSEPDVFGIDDLRRKGTSPWDGVRNFQARNHMRAMAVGDQVLFYHSSAKPSGAAGLAEVVRAAYPDHTSWDPASPYYDRRSTPGKPLWDMVDVAWRATFARLVPLDELRGTAGLEGMLLFSRSRLSVQPVGAAHFRLICRLGAQPAKPAPGTAR